VNSHHTTKVSYHENPRTNYRLKDGDRVLLLEPAKVDSYWYDDVHCPRGSYESHYMLPNTIGTVVKARTPCVTSIGGKTCYFANVDVEYNGTKHRVRVYHSVLKKLSQYLGTTGPEPSPARVVESS
jgi:hypothetical protein